MATPPGFAPPWVRPLIATLDAAGFAEVSEQHDRMQSYEARFARDGVTISVLADRGQWWLMVSGESLRRGRGIPRERTIDLDLYRTALRGDETPDALFAGTPEERAEESAAWLAGHWQDVLDTWPDAEVWERVVRLRTARMKRMFG